MYPNLPLWVVNGRNRISFGPIIQRSHAKKKKNGLVETAQPINKRFLVIICFDNSQFHLLSKRHLDKRAREVLLQSKIIIYKYYLFQE